MFETLVIRLLFSIVKLDILNNSIQCFSSYYLLASPRLWKSKLGSFHPEKDHNNKKYLVNSSVRHKTNVIIVFQSGSTDDIKLL